VSPLSVNRPLSSQHCKEIVVFVLFYHSLSRQPKGLMSATFWDNKERHRMEWNVDETYNNSDRVRFDSIEKRILELRDG